MDGHGWKRLLLLWAVLLGACARKTPVVPDDSILTGEPCTPPCWQGLTPGQTSAEEAIVFLQNSPLVDGNLGEQSVANEGGSSQGWWWAGDKHEYWRENVLSFDQHGVLNHIFFRPNVEIAIGKIMEVYGPPAVVSMGVNTPENSAVSPAGIGLAAIFTDHAFLVSWAQATDIRRSPIRFCPSLQTAIAYVDYYTPELAATQENMLRHTGYGVRGLAVDGSTLFQVVGDEVRVNCVEID